MSKYKIEATQTYNGFKHEFTSEFPKGKEFSGIAHHRAFIETLYRSIPENFQILDKPRQFQLAIAPKDWSGAPTLLPYFAIKYSLVNE